MHPEIRIDMKRIVLCLLFLGFGLSSYAESNPSDKSESVTDTIRTSVVTGTRVPLLRDRVSSPVSVVSLSRILASDETAVMPAVMEQVPGLFITSRGVTGYGVSGGAAGSISLRGFGAGNGRVLILIDGHPQFESIYGHPVADEYLSGGVQRVEVLRGAASTLYGSNAMGGAINIITSKPEKEGNTAELKLMGGSYGSWRASLGDSFRKGRLSLSANLSADHTDGHRANSAFTSLGGVLTAGYEISDALRLKSRLSLSDARSENPGTVTDPMFECTAHTIRGMASVSLDNHLSNASGVLDLYLNWGNHIINDGYTAGGKPQEYLFHGTDYTAGITLYESFRLFRGNSLTTGADLMIYGGNAYRNPVTEVYADHKRLNECAVYVSDTQTLGKFTLNAGVRMDRHSAYGIKWIPQAGVTYIPEANTTIKLSVSNGFRMPNMRELYMYAVANEDLLPEDAWSYDLTLGHHFLDGKLNLEASAFYTTGSNIIAVTVVDGRPQNHNVGEFANSGIELSADWKACENLSFNANYSFLHMDTIYTGAPEHKLYLGADFSKGRFSANIGAMGIAGLYLTTGESAVKEQYVDLKARLAYQLCKGISIFVRGQNLLNRTYQTMLGFPVPGITVFGGVSIKL